MFGDGVDAEMIEEFGGLRAMAEVCAASGCCCEPCLLCEEDTPHEVGHGCQDYFCLKCEAIEYLEEE